MKHGGLVVVLVSAATEPLLGLAQDSFASDIRDIRGPLPMPEPWWSQYESFLVAGLAGLAAALLAWALVRLFQPAPDPRAQAIARIDRARAMAPQLGAKPFVHEVSEAVRAYVEARFDVHAREQTTEELLATLAQDEASPLARFRGPLADFLVSCDLVKFGAASLSAAEIDALADSARLLVVESASAPAPPRAEAA